MFSPPFYYVPMPVNSIGDGPADANETSRVLHEVWDSTFATVCECRDEAAARWLAARLNDHQA